MPIRIIEPAAGVPAPAAPAPVQQQARKVRILEPASGPGVEQGAEPTRTSQVLGFAKGAFEPMARLSVGVEDGLRGVGYPVDAIHHAMGRPTDREASEQFQGYLADKRAEGVRPGKVGEAAGNFAIAAPITAVTKNPWAVGAMTGGFLGKGETAGDIAFDVGTGAIMGKVGQKAVDVIGKAVAPAISPAVRKLADAGIRLTPGQIRGGKAMVREDKAMSRPRVGEAIAEARAGSIDGLNRAVINRALEPMGVKLPASVPTGYDAVAFAQQTLDDAYSAIVPKLSVKVDPRFVAGAKRLYTDLSTLPKAQQEQFQAILQNIRFTNGQLSGQALKNAQSDLGRLAKTYGTSGASGERELGRIVRALKDNLDDMMIRQNPADAPALKAVNKAYRGLTIVENAASKADGGVFSTGQLKTAVRQGDGSIRKRKTASGQAFMQDLSDAARAVLPSKTPDSGTAGRSMAGNLIQEARGAVDEVGQRINTAVSQAALRANPRLMTAVRNRLQQLEGPAAFAFPMMTAERRN